MMMIMIGALLMPPLFHDEQSHHQNTQMHRFLVINKLLDNMKSIQCDIITIKSF